MCACFVTKKDTCTDHASIPASFATYKSRHCTMKISGVEPTSEYHIAWHYNNIVVCMTYDSQSNIVHAHVGHCNTCLIISVQLEHYACMSTLPIRSSNAPGLTSSATSYGGYPCIRSVPLRYVIPSAAICTTSSLSFCPCRDPAMHHSRPRLRRHGHSMHVHGL